MERRTAGDLLYALRLIAAFILLYVTYWGFYEVFGTICAETAEAVYTSILMAVLATVIVYFTFMVPFTNRLLDVLFPEDAYPVEREKRDIMGLDRLTTIFILFILVAGLLVCSAPSEVELHVRYAVVNLNDRLTIDYVGLYFWLCPEMEFRGLRVYPEGVRCSYVIGPMEEVTGEPPKYYASINAYYDTAIRVDIENIPPRGEVLLEFVIVEKGASPFFMKPFFCAGYIGRIQEYDVEGRGWLLLIGVIPFVYFEKNSFFEVQPRGPSFGEAVSQSRTLQEAIFNTIWGPSGDWVVVQKEAVVLDTETYAETAFRIIDGGLGASDWVLRGFVERWLHHFDYRIREGLVQQPAWLGLLLDYSGIIVVLIAIVVCVYLMYVGLKKARELRPRFRVV